jgi:hypothetical protein
LKVNLRIAFPVYRDWKVIADGSYLFGITDLNRSATGEDKTQEALVLVGLQFPLGRGDSGTEAVETKATSESSQIGGLTPIATEAPKSEPKRKKDKRK